MTTSLWHRWPKVPARCCTLRELDDHALRDLGIHRSEIPSIEYELLHGEAGQFTRLRLVSWRQVPGVA